MPVFNEERTIALAADAVLSAKYPCEIELIVVDDGSTDATGEFLSYVRDPRVVIHRHERNRGKGAALRTAARLASGTHFVPFDADLEYSPADLPRMLEPILHGRCDIVYGTRLFGVNTVYQSYRHAMGNRLLTLAANMLFDAYLCDMHTCLKLVPLQLFHELELKEEGFGLDTEITAKILKLGLRPFEVPVSYHSRSAAHGKKITWRDGVECLQVLGRVRFRRGLEPILAEGSLSGPLLVDELAPNPPAEMTTPTSSSDDLTACSRRISSNSLSAEAASRRAAREDVVGMSGDGGLR